ncbi:hypothetical protein KC330_g81 [Hortaea werneckii]|nr:hypothetical protein KC330_g81 [Hortaea werneckii]
MELSAHGVVVVAGHGANCSSTIAVSTILGLHLLVLATQRLTGFLTQAPVLPIPYPNSLIVTCTDNPRQLVVEEDGAHIIQVAIQGEHAPSRLVVPHFDLVIITSGNKHGLRPVEVHAPNGSIVLFKAIDEGAHAVVPQLNGGRMQGNEDPWALGMEGETLGAGGFRFELGEHWRRGSHGGGGGGGGGQGASAPRRGRARQEVGGVGGGGGGRRGWGGGRAWSSRSSSRAASSWQAVCDRVVFYKCQASKVSLRLIFGQTRETPHQQSTSLVRATSLDRVNAATVFMLPPFSCSYGVPPCVWFLRRCMVTWNKQSIQQLWFGIWPALPMDKLLPESDLVRPLHHIRSRFIILCSRTSGPQTSILVPVFVSLKRRNKSGRRRCPAATPSAVANEANPAIFRPLRPVSLYFSYFLCLTDSSGSFLPFIFPQFCTPYLDTHPTHNMIHAGFRRQNQVFRRHHRPDIAIEHSALPDER